MKDDAAQQLLDWVHANVEGTVTTEELKEAVDYANLPIDAKEPVADLPDREWTKEELLEEIDGMAPDGAAPSGGFTPSSGSPV